MRSYQVPILSPQPNGELALEALSPREYISAPTLQAPFAIVRDGSLRIEAGIIVPDEGEKLYIQVSKPVKVKLPKSSHGEFGFPIVVWNGSGGVPFDLIDDNRIPIQTLYPGQIAEFLLDDLGAHAVALSGQDAAIFPQPQPSKPRVREQVPPDSGCFQAQRQPHRHPRGFLGDAIALRDRAAKRASISGNPNIQNFTIVRGTKILQIDPQPMITSSAPRLDRVGTFNNTRGQVEEWTVRGVSRRYNRAELLDNLPTYCIGATISGGRLVGGITCEYVSHTENYATWDIKLRRKIGEQKLY